ncbi:MAG: GxxExxY protein [Ignavibacteria bacterium]
MGEIIFPEESYKIIGICMEIHRILGKGLSEVVYKDALEYEFNCNKVPFYREKKYDVIYKDVILNHSFVADFVIYDKIILEVKAIEKLIDTHKKQTLNYLGITKKNLGLLVNFGEPSLKYERIVL